LDITDSLTEKENYYCYLQLFIFIFW